MPDLEFDAANFDGQFAAKDPFDLLNQIDPDNPTPDSVRLYLYALHAYGLAHGQHGIPVEEYYSDSALATWKRAWDKRPKDITIAPDWDLLHLRQLLYNALTPFKCARTGLHVTNLETAVERAESLLSVWLSENTGTSDLRAHRNRQAQQRHRLRNSDNMEDPRVVHAKAVSEAYEAYMQVCAERKKAMDSWTGVVAEKRQQWLALRDNPPS